MVKAGTVDQATDATGESPPGGWLRRALVAPAFGVALWVWLVGGSAAAALMGPALGPGSLLNLDLVSVPDLPVPHGVWGLGPELPRRVPLWLFLTWISEVIGGDATVKVLILVGLTVAFAGMYRLVDRPGLVGVGAAALYAFSPFLLTRVAVGHLMILWAMALLPWALPDLIEPHRSLRRDLWWAAAIGISGIYGGLVCGFVLAAGLIATRGRRLVGVVLVYLVAQLPWLAPVLVVGWNGSIVDGSAFATPVRGVSGVGALLAGQGFWNGFFQIGKDHGGVAAVLGFAVLALAVIGTPELPRPLRTPLVGLAALGLFITVGLSVPGLEDVGSWFTRTMIGGPFREPQRFLVLYLLWAAPAAALGAGRLARSLRGAPAATLSVVPLAIVVLLAGPAWWGFDDQLRPATFPQEWAQAKAAVDAEPGTMVAFPWYQYFSFDVADNRLVLSVAPFYFGGDVVISSDPNITAEPRRERSDPREEQIQRLATAARQGATVSDGLAAMGVRWLLLQREVNWYQYTGVLEDPGLDLVVSGPSLDLYRVRDWAGAVTTPDGREVPSSPVVSPYRQVDPSGPARLAAPYQTGWLRGWESATASPEGLISLPAGSGPVWYWPALVVIAADLITLGVLVGSLVFRNRRGRSAQIPTESHNGADTHAKVI